MKSLAARVAERMAPKQQEKRPSPKADLLLAAIKEFRSAKSDEEALEAFHGLKEISELED